MHVIETKLEGVVVIEPECFRDGRGFFFESYHKQRYKEHSLDHDFVQDNHSRSDYGVLRGIHYQDMTAPQGKLVRCTRGQILDVAVDLRVGSPTFSEWVAVDLSEDNMKQLMIPPGFGHAFVTLSEWADMQYKCTGYYTPASEGTVAWNDPDIGIVWPIENPIVSKRDRLAMTLRKYLERPAFRYHAT